MTVRSEILPLTGIRAFAAFGVLLAHYHPELIALLPGFSILDPISSRGGLGVDLFFILSGFIIAYVYKTTFQTALRRAYVPYLVNRFARIYPNYFVTLTLLVLMVGIGGALGVSIQGDYPWQWLPAHYLMLQPVPGVPGGWNYPGWSIGAEFFAYACVFPAFISFIRRFRPGPGWALTLCPLLLLAFWIPKNLGWWGQSEHLPMVTAEFLCGALLHSACTGSDTIRSWMGRLLPATVLLMAAVMFFNPLWSRGWDRAGLVLLFIPLLGGLFASSGRIARLFALAPIVYFGHASYALYLVHAIVQKILKATFLGFAMNSGSPPIRLMVFALYLIAPLLAASLLYHIVEEPCRKWIRGKCRPALHGG